jgi:hypothetical protein
MKILIATVLAGCVGDTGGAHVGFTAEALAVAPATHNKIIYDDADTGWHVELTTAKVFLGPVYLWSGKPLNGASAREAPTYYAADQFDFGFLRGQVVEQAPIDLVATAGHTTPIGAGDGLAGQALSAELWLSPPTDGAGDTFVVAGTATKNGIALEFSGGLTIDDTVVDEQNGDTAFTKRKVRAIPFDGMVAEGGTVSVECDARRWLADAPFDDFVPDPAPAAPATIAAPIAFPDGVWNQWFYQVRQSRGVGPWTLTWRAP